MGCQSKLKKSAAVLSVNLRESARGLLAPTGDRPGLCRDVGDVRVCWGAVGGEAPLAEARPLPWLLDSPQLRCVGRGQERRCLPRFSGVGRFLCQGASCVQKHPRLPDAAEWSCADQNGAVVCRDAGGSAVSSRTLPDATWLCGQRRNTSERLCVNFDPDHPDAAGAQFWNCRFEALPNAERICTRVTQATSLGAPCGKTLAACPSGAVCASDVCVPAVAVAECWLDTDCGAGESCRFGACTPESGRKVAENTGKMAPLAQPPETNGWWLLLRAKGMDVPDRIEVSPEANVVGYQVFDDTWRLHIQEGSRQVTVQAAGACPVNLKAPPAGAMPRLLRAELVPRLQIVRDRAEVGFGESFRLKAVPNCAVPEESRIRWQQRALPSGKLTESWGNELSGRMPSLKSVLGAELPWGIVPISPRTQQKLSVRATLLSPTGNELGNATTTLSAAARASGLPNVAVNHTLQLGGGGWQLLKRPPGSHAELGVGDGFSSFLADMPGNFELRDDAGRGLRVHAARLDSMPLDCGRSGCHTEVVKSFESNPMAKALDIVPVAERACAVGCHTQGEAELDDGGSGQVRRELGLTEFALTSADVLPRDLERVSHVGCLGCHGPGAIPEATARWGIVRSAVCAVCHDSPPEYGHHQAWSETAMAKPPTDARMQNVPCARCHTTTGFLHTQTVDAPLRDPPPQVRVSGLTCVTCHAVHSDSKLPHLLRAVKTEGFPVLGLGSSQVCVSCHSAGSREEYPSASAASIWAGSGGFEPITGEPLAGPTAHRDQGRGCLLCHGGDTGGLKRGADHSFTASRDQCQLCHAAPLGASELRGRAERAWAALGFEAWSQHGQERRHFSRTSARDRARYNLSLVFEDPAFDAHNSAYAELLIAAVERFISHTAPTRIPSTP